MITIVSSQLTGWSPHPIGPCKQSSGSSKLILVFIHVNLLLRLGVNERATVHWDLLRSPAVNPITRGWWMCPAHISPFAVSCGHVTYIIAVTLIDCVQPDWGAEWFAPAAFSRSQKVASAVRCPWWNILAWKEKRQKVSKKLATPRRDVQIWSVDLLLGSPYSYRVLFPVESLSHDKPKVHGDKSRPTGGAVSPKLKCRIFLFTNQRANNHPKGTVT